MTGFRLFNVMCCLILNFRISHSRPTFYTNPSEFYGDFPPTFQNSNHGPPVASTSFIQTIGTVSHVLNQDSLIGLMGGLSPMHSLFSLSNRNANNERSRPAYNGLSRPDITWERHIGVDDGQVPRGTPAPPVTNQLMSFSDYVQKATYDWLKKYKMAYYNDYFQKMSRANSTEPPNLSLSNSVSESTTTYAPNSSTTTPPPAETTITTTPPTTTTTPATTTTTTTTTTTKIPTTTRLTQRYRLDDSMNEIRVGFLPDQPNLGTRWYQNMEHYVPFAKS